MSVDTTSKSHLDVTLPFSSTNTLIETYHSYISREVSALINQQLSSDGSFELPLLKAEYDKAKHNVLIKCLAPNAPHFSSFLLDMISRWLIPERPLTPLHHSASQINTPSIPFHDTCLFTISFLKLPEDISFETLETHLKEIKHEIKLGATLSNQAKHILELKGAHTGNKITRIHQLLASLIKRYPNHLSKDIYRRLHALIATTDDCFFLKRSADHLVKILSYQQYFYNQLDHPNSSSGQAIHLKTIRTKITQNENSTPVLGLVFQFKSNGHLDHFNDQKFLQALALITPHTKIEEHSYFCSPNKSSQFSLYVEIANTNYRAFSKTEEALITHQAPTILKNCIEPAITSIIMPSNEEEIMRYIILLAQQIQYKKDIPQVYICFDEQSARELFFSVVLVRPISKETPSISALIHNAPTPQTHLELLRLRPAGSIDEDTKKEACILRCKLQKRPFIREDHTLKLNQARKEVYSHLTSIFGPIRDYIGGLIDQQNQQLLTIEKSIPKYINYTKDQLESFFYAIRPASLRSIFPKEAITELFLLCNRSSKRNKVFGWNNRALKKSTQEYRYWILLTQSPEERSSFIRQLQNINIGFSNLIYSSLQFPSQIILGVAVRNTTPEQEKKIDYLTQTFSSQYG